MTLIIIVLFVAAFFDGARDAGIWRRTGVSWWQWHLVKWIGFYTPLVFICARTFHGWALLLLVPLAGLGWLLWQAGAKAGEWFYENWYWG